MFILLYINFSTSTKQKKKERTNHFRGSKSIKIITRITTFHCLTLFARALGQASPNLTAFAAGQAAAFKMFETIKRKPEIDVYDTSGRQLDDINGDIELKEVHFSYPSRPDDLIFDGFSLSIPSGTIAALVGQSGSGKSTVLSLIERFYDPQFGQVLIDGINLKDFQLKWIRQKIGLVSQEPILFACSIKENISYGKDGATEEEIRAAIKLANAAKFIDELPQVNTPKKKVFRLEFSILSNIESDHLLLE